MLYGEYDFRARFEERARLPPFKGSTLRGALGTALKRVFCVLRRQDCARCVISQRCAYCRIFESFPSRDDERGQTDPHPFVVVPPLSSRTDFEAGDPLRFSLILFGEAVRDLPYMIYAIEEMGREGLGRTIDGKRGRFTLHEVLLNGKRLYCSEDRVLAQCEPGHLLLSRMPRPTHKVERVLLRLETPLRLKYRNRLHPELPFHLLVRAMLRRIASLNARFGEGEPDLDYKGLVRRAEKAREAASSLQWTDWARYSNRQEQKMLMGGLTGTIQYEGDLSEFIPLLHYSEKVHLGKATTFGLGRIRVEH